MTSARIQIKLRQYLELENIALGCFSPLNRFMDEDDLSSVTECMHLPDGQLFPLPVVLDVTQEEARAARKAERVALEFSGQEIGEIAPNSVYTCDKGDIAERVYGTRDTRHPGVAQWLSMGEFFIGGQVRLNRRISLEFSLFNPTPEETRKHFASLGWRTIVGFQTRNVPHRAHEYLLRLALEQADGLFIQPLVGLKKRGDFTAAAILTAYRTLIDGFLPKERILLGVLSTTMRYAGPREALMHAIVRRNHGCTHFIVGRDHAGVGNYYGIYDARDLAGRYEDELGIKILRYAGPYHCSKCDGIVTEYTCPHEISLPQAVRQISGTGIRSMLVESGTVDTSIMRSEIVDSLRQITMFVDDDGE
jgi:sulfate adenylyltransferase